MENNNDIMREILIYRGDEETGNREQEWLLPRVKH